MFLAAYKFAIFPTFVTSNLVSHNLFVHIGLVREFLVPPNVYIDNLVSLAFYYLADMVPPD